MVVSKLSVVDQVMALNEKTSSLQVNQEAQQRSLLNLQDKISQVDESVDRTGSKLSAELSSQGDTLKKSWEAGNKAIDNKTSKLQASQESQQEVLINVQSKVSEVDENLELTGKRLTEELTSQGEAIKQTMEDKDQNQQKLLEGDARTNVLC